MKKYISFNSVLLFLLTIVVLWLVYKTNNVSPNDTAYMPNQIGGFRLIKTEYGSFPVIIDDTRSSNNVTELSLIFINPLNIHFGDTEISVEGYGSIETVKMNLVPGTNGAKFKIPYIERDHPVKIMLKLKKIYFK
jgi:hypothetical protein